MATSRRWWIGGVSVLGGAAAAGYLIYRQFPAFWRQYAREMQMPILPPPETPSPKQWPDRGLHATWLGHSTVLLKVDGFTIITDPVFSDRAGLNLGPVTLGVKRAVAPALRIDELPHIDLILNSHAHMDHLDVPSLRKLENPKTQLLMASETSDLVRAARYQAVHEMRWGDSKQVGPARVRALEVNHWGARMRTDTYRGYNGYLIEIAGRRILFAGDTAATGAFRSIKQSRPVDLAIMPIGAYNPWIRYHCTPEQAWRMADDASADVVMPVHHRTFKLSNEPVGEPLERFLTAAAGRDSRVALTTIGATFRAS